MHRFRLGRETSEYRQLRTANTLTVVGVAAGATVTVLSEIGAPDAGGPWGAIAGGLLAVASIVYNTLATLGYTSARTRIKIEGEDKNNADH